MLLAFNNGNNDTANVLLIIAAILFGLAAVLHLLGAFPAGGAPAEPGARRGAWWVGGWPTIFVDAGLCLVAIAFLIA